MIYTIIFFTWRYLQGSSAKGPLSALAKICFGAILLGTFCLTLVAAIMHGFKQATYTTLQSIHPDLIMETNSIETLNIDAIKNVLKKEFPAVTAFAPRASNFVILEKKYEHSTQQTIVTLQALEPDHEAQTTQLEQTLHIPKNSSLAKCIGANNIAIGSKLSQDLKVGIGDTLTIYYAPNEQATSHNITFQAHTVHISGIFSTGIADYDASVLWGSYDLFNALFPDDGITSLGLRLATEANHKQMANDLQKRFGLTVSLWYTLYPALLQALQLEQCALFIILFFIVVLAALTMASTLMLHIEHKRTDIALLRAMGMASYMVRRIFMLIGLSIALTATACGMLSGWIASWILDTYQLITLPEAYYISYLPAHITLSYFFILFGIACAISLAAVWYAAGNSNTHSISAILRGRTN